MKKNDDFNWNEYTEISYLKEIDVMENDGYDFKVNKSTVVNKQLILEDKLHPNWVAIYSSIIESNVASVFECGCGGCYHLYNINKLLPTIKVGGCDISEDQIKRASKALEIPESITRLIKLCDFSQELQFEEKYEFVFTQAVIMHLSYDKAVRFINNMKKLSSKYIMMVENQSEHNFNDLLRESSVLDEFDLVNTVHKGVNGIFLTRKTNNVTV